MTGLPAPELATAGDLVEFLENQHVTIRTLFDAALSPEKGIDSGSFTRLRGLLAVHEAVEAMLVHPWSRGISEAGRTVANT
ncbi:hemerythrin domain-containing protein, partial [Mycobacteroides abscessus subsp. massiliense]